MTSRTGALASADLWLLGSPIAEFGRGFVEAWHRAACGEVSPALTVISSERWDGVGPGAAPLSRAAFRKTLTITEQTIGSGEKQTSFWIIRDRDDPKGARGSQRTASSKEGAEWEIEQAYRAHLLIGWPARPKAET